MTYPGIKELPVFKQWLEKQPQSLVQALIMDAFTKGHLDPEAQILTHYKAQVIGETNARNQRA